MKNKILKLVAVVFVILSVFTDFDYAHPTNNHKKSVGNAEKPNQE